MKKCPICENKNLQVTKFSCKKCGISFGGNFYMKPLSRLSDEDMELAQLLVIHGGNLKDMAEEIGITYPTLKKRLNKISETLQKLRQEDEEFIAGILDKMESGEISPEEGMRIIKEVKNDL